MELLDESFVNVDDGVLPEDVRIALMTYWDDGASELVNLSRILHWLRQPKVQAGNS